MALTNGQYEKIQREYSRRIARDREAQQVRIADAFARIPALKEIEETISDLAMERAKAMLLGNEAKADRLARQLADLREQKEVLLISEGFAANYLELQYECPRCMDTGYIDGKKCSCMQKLIIDTLYDQSAIRDHLEKENFRTFSYEFFDKTVKDTGTGLSSYDTMKRNVEISQEFIRKIDSDPGNLLLMGQAGTGKTFLTNCIARELMDQYHSVIYLSSAQLFEMLAKQAFDRKEDPESAEASHYILECDLLIIDDLGTELNNSFVGSRLFYCINERIVRRKATIISTNLSMNDIQRQYTERVASRLMGSYQILRFPNVDIRIRKKMQAYQ